MDRDEALTPLVPRASSCLLFAWLALLAACAPAAPAPRAILAGAPSHGTSEAVSAAATDAPGHSPRVPVQLEGQSIAPAVSATPSTPTAPRDPACTGANIDLAHALFGPACPAAGQPAEVPEGAILVRIASPRPLAPGAEANVEVTFENTSEHDVELRVLREYGDYSNPGPPPDLLRGRVVRTSQSTLDADGNDYDEVGGYAEGGRAVGQSSVTIAPHGVARMRAVVRARGFHPFKRYDPRDQERDEPRDALPPGRYTVRLGLPVSWPRKLTVPSINLVVR